MNILIDIDDRKDQLSQEEWDLYVKKTEEAIKTHGSMFIIYNGRRSKVWQVKCPDDKIKFLQGMLIEIRKHFRQDSIVWTEGKTLFI